MTPIPDPDEFKQRVADGFDRRIGRGDYDKGGFHSRLADRLVELADPQPGQRVLDLATGTGFVAVRAARRVGPAGRVVGVDISPGMLARAAGAVEAEGLGNVEVIWGDAETVDFPPHGFDHVLCSSALPYMTDIPGSLRRWRAFLRPGGTVAFNCWSEASFVSGYIGGLVAARHGITLPVTGERLGTEDRCRGVLVEAGYVDPRVVADPDGRFVPAAEVEAAWETWTANPIFQPRRPGELEKLLGLRDEYLAEVRSRATDRGVWDEWTAYYAIAQVP